ncbi:MAG: hypothetical protein U5N53_25110 [Mycobacterium sp.]|nr:hypothetical protein [Mycobacterium sp.]
MAATTTTKQGSLRAMTKIVDNNSEAAPTTDLTEEVRDSAKAGQHAASEALRKFRHAVDEAIPESVQPLRTKIVDAAIELADDLVTAQYKFPSEPAEDRRPGLDQV